MWAARRGDRVMAVKVLSDLRPGSPYAEAILRETRLGPLLADHPGVVAVRHVEEVDGVLHLEMDWVQGPNLQQVIDTRVAAGDPPLPCTVAVTWMVQVLETLHWAASRVAENEPGRFVHRDIKPANLLVDETGRIRISDFGMARAALTLGLPTTDTRTVKGTPRFMAPEVLRDGPIDGRADQFSVGAVLYELLSHRPIYRADTMAAVLAKAMSADVEPAIAALEAPPGLLNVLHRLLARDPDRRYLDHSAAASALSNLVLEGPAVADVIEPLLEAALGPEPSESWPRVPLLTLHQTMFRGDGASSPSSTFDDEPVGPRISPVSSTYDDEEPGKKTPSVSSTAVTLESAIPSGVRLLSIPPTPAPAPPPSPPRGGAWTVALAAVVALPGVAVLALVAVMAASALLAGFLLTR